MNSFNVYELKSSQVIRIYVSDVASVSGYHIWTNMLEKFENYVYQDLEDLYLLDAQNLSLDINQLDLNSLAPFLSSAEVNCLKSIEISSDSKGAYEDKAQVQKSLEVIDKIFKSVEARQKADIAAASNVPSDNAAITGKAQELLNEQCKLLKSDYRSKVCKRYGITCESSALDAYTEITGYPVDSRNTTQLTWHIPIDSSQLEEIVLQILNDQKSHSFLSIDKGSREVFKSVELMTVLSPYIVSGYRNKSCSDMPQKERYAFTIVGRPDGISYHLDMTIDDHTLWRFEVCN